MSPDLKKPVSDLDLDLEIEDVDLYDVALVQGNCGDAESLFSDDKTEK